MNSFGHEERNSAAIWFRGGIERREIEVVEEGMAGRKSGWSMGDGGRGWRDGEGAGAGGRWRWCGRGMEKKSVSGCGNSGRQRRRRLNGDIGNARSVVAAVAAARVMLVSRDRGKGR